MTSSATRHIQPLLGHLALAAAALTLNAGCGPGGNTDPDLSSETHWMRLCDDGQSCGPGGQCVCGVCTLPCDDNLDCGDAGPLTACVDLQNLEPGRCNANPSNAAGLCLAPCQSDDACAPLEGALICQIDHCLPDDRTCLDNADCPDGDLCLIQPTGACLNPFTPGTCSPRPEACIEISAPVCGCDGNTYDNSCFAQAAGVNVAADAPCEVSPGACLGNADCPSDHLCAFPEADPCGLLLELPGACAPRPEACPEIFDPVCGCDGDTYSNACEAAANGVNPASPGQCEEACTEELAPVCGVDGNTYDNACEADRAGVEIAHEGECEEAPRCGGIQGLICPRDLFCQFTIEQTCGAADHLGTCVAPPEICTQEVAPVCGCDGRTHTNACEAARAGVSVAAEGRCDGPEPVTCGGFIGLECEDQGTFCQFTPEQFCGSGDQTGVCVERPEVCIEILAPVCGCDGNTYDNACFAQAAGVSVSFEGACAPSACADDRQCGPAQLCRFPAGTCGRGATGQCQDRPEVCAEIFAPVCGCDGNTYSNECFANSTGMNIAQTGECP